MHFDLRTIYFTGTFVFAVCTIAIVMIWYQSRNRIAGIGFLAIDLAMQTAAILLTMFRSTIPDWMSISLANILVMAGSILGLMGLERFVGKITSQTYNFCLLAVYAFAFIYFGRVPTDVSLRMMVFLVGTLPVWFQCAWLMLIRVGPVMRAQTLWVGAVFVVYCLMNTFRITTIIGEPSMGLDYFKSGLLTMLAILTYQALFLFLTLALILMFNKRLLMEIGEEEEKFSKAFHFSSQAIMLCDLSDGRIIEVNRQFESLFGYPYQEAVGMTIDEMQFWASPEDRDAVIDEFTKWGHTRGKEYRFRSRDGASLTGILHTEMLQINGKKFTLISINDITARKRAEEQLERLNLTLQERVKEEIDKRLLHERMLVNQSRLAAMGMMIGAIAHQWRQPLSTLDVIIQRFHALSTLHKLSQKQLDDFKISAMQTIRYMSETIEEFRAFHQPEKQRTEYDPRPCITSAVNLFAPQFRADGITLDFVDSPEDMCSSLYGYPNELKQVLVNLISNARHAILDRRAIDDGFMAGSITIRVFMLRENTLAIDVEDNGCGVPAEIVPNLFDPYFTTRQSDTGTGIGLYLSRGIVEGSLEGRIHLVQGRLQGATFRIELPLKEETL